MRADVRVVHRLARTRARVRASRRTGASSQAWGRTASPARAGVVLQLGRRRPPGSKPTCSASGAWRAPFVSLSTVSELPRPRRFQPATDPHRDSDVARPGGRARTQLHGLACHRCHQRRLAQRRPRLLDHGPQLPRRRSIASVLLDAIMHNAWAINSPRWGVVPNSVMPLPVSSPAPNAPGTSASTTTTIGGMPVKFTPRQGWAATIIKGKPRRAGASIGSRELRQHDQGRAVPDMG